MTSPICCCLEYSNKQNVVSQFKTDFALQQSIVLNVQFHGYWLIQSYPSIFHTPAVGWTLRSRSQTKQLIKTALKNKE